MTEQETAPVAEHVDDERRQHPTGQSTASGSEAKAPDTPEEEEEQTLIGPELEVWQGKITKRQQRELLRITKPVQEAVTSDQNNSVVHRELPTPKASSIPKEDKKKRKRSEGRERGRRRVTLTRTAHQHPRRHRRQPRMQAISTNLTRFVK